MLFQYRSICRWYFKIIFMLYFDDSSFAMTNSSSWTPSLYKVFSWPCYFRLDELVSVHRAHVLERDDITSRMESCTLDQDQPGSSSVLENRYRFFHEMRGYVGDLVECLAQKVGWLCTVVGVGWVGRGHVGVSFLYGWEILENPVSSSRSLWGIMGNLHPDHCEALWVIFIPITVRHYG